MTRGISINLSFDLLVAMICRCGQVEKKEARGLAAELIGIIDTWRVWCAANPDRRDAKLEEEDVVFTLVRHTIGCWPKAEGWPDGKRDEKVHDVANESVWMMDCLTGVSDELYQRYLEITDRVLGHDLASALSPDGPKARLQ
jgi:hypothetical protein